jgi:hypothetical protein
MSVFANGKSIVHKGHGKTQLAVAPDVCKTPSPGGPIPIPYPNMSPDSNLTDGAATVMIAGNPVGNTGSTLSRSNGDEAGTAGGLVSSKNMGAFGWSAGSTDVEAEGKGVVRLLDAISTNGNTYNDAGMTIGMGIVSYGDDQRCPRAVCKLDHDIKKHKISQDKASATLSRQLADEVSRWDRSDMGPKGRMVGIAKCKCGVVYKAVSGNGPEDPAEAAELYGTMLQGVESKLCDTVLPSSDPAIAQIQAANPYWLCAAAKIFSQASGHKIEEMLERWVGALKQGERFKKKMTGKTPAVFHLVDEGGALVLKVPDMVKGFDRDEVKTGDGVPSCGKCQSFLPAYICEQIEC